ncbi:MAG: FAD-dependent oxidoreductase [Coriobacteriia bacterium]|nr:FAD-dependent oxidoreductase [Coriobacteriia bacterium]
MQVFDENHKFSPKYDENITVTVPCQHVIFSIGQRIDWGDMLADEAVELRPNGGILADKLTMQTAQPDIFTAGDVYTGPKFAIDAIAGGREAAISIHRFVHDNCTLTIGRNRRDFIAIDKQNVDFGDHNNEPREINEITPEDKPSFNKIVETFTEEQTKAECERCLACGASHVDENKCIGCGVCTTKCVFDAITLSRKNPENSTMITSEDKLKVILPNMAKLKIKTAFKSKKF